VTAIRLQARPGARRQPGRYQGPETLDNSSRFGPDRGRWFRPVRPGAARGYLAAAGPYARRLGRRPIGPLALARSLDRVSHILKKLNVNSRIDIARESALRNIGPR